MSAVSSEVNHADLWGAAGGFQQFNQDESNLATAALGRQNTQQQMQERQLDIQKKEMDLKRTQVVMGALQSAALGKPAGQPGSKNPIEAMNAQADEMQSTADTLFKAGAPEMGMTYAKEAADLRVKAATITDHEAGAAQKTIKAAMYKAQLQAQLLGSVTDAASWQQATQQYAKTTGDDTYTQIPYDPGTVAAFHANAMTAYQQAQVKLSTIKTQAEVAKDDAQIRHYAATEETSREALRIREEGEQRREKAAGKPATAPTSNDMETARRELKIAIPGLTGSEKDRAASYIAADAKRAVTENPALTYPEAITRATQQYKKEGKFLIGPPDKAGKSAITFNPDASFKPGAGKNPTTPLPFSSYKDAKDGDFIQTPKGLVRYDAKSKKFIAVASGSGAPVTTTSDDDNEEDD